MKKKNLKQNSSFFSLILDFFTSIRENIFLIIFFLLVFLTISLVNFFLQGASIKTSATGIFLGLFFLLFFYLVLIGICLYFLTASQKRSLPFKKAAYLFGTLLTFYFLFARIFEYIGFCGSDGLQAIILPQALFIVIIALLSHFELALFAAFALPLPALIFGALGPYSYLYALASSLSALLLIKNAQSRGAFVRRGFFLSILQVLLSVFIYMLLQSTRQEFLRTISLAAGTGFLSALLVLGVLPIFERTLKTHSIFSLQELANLNSPLLKKLQASAGGTFSHSIVVANLADAAAQDIGADALLARVGAYYHDIGKMDQPHYFTENQAFYNKHDEIVPRLSAAVIRSHLKLGVEKARQAGLPEAVIEIIAEHHGNSVISYFFQEARKNENRVQSEDFAYPGQPPRSKESAIVMLADSVEAGVRSNKNYSLPRLEKRIQELIALKVEQGQLLEADLTLKELELIKAAFARVLAGQYHSRIEYPKADSEENDE